MTQKKWFLRALPHTIALLIFLLAAFVYCRPAFDHKVLVQEDMTQWRAMAHSSFVYKQQHGHFPLWTESMFSGMPAFLIAMEANVFSPQGYANDLLTLHLPTPANYFFLACVCFYFLTRVLRVNPYIGIITSLAYAYATYNPVIISVGHDTKMAAIATLPAFIGGLLLIYDKRYAWGAASTALFTALMVSANHMQIFYYGLIIAACMTCGYIIRWIIQKEWKHLLIALTLAGACWLTGILCNAVVIFTTYDFTKATIRGGSELADDPSAKKGLSTDYAFSYSLYPNESFVLLVPKMYGGSSASEFPQGHSKAIATLHDLPKQTAAQIEGNDLMSWYWGGIGGTAGPAYAGAIICFFALIGMFILDNKHKWWIAATCLLALCMSWGGYFAGFNGLLLKYLPMYNKFRAPSVILVIPVFLLTVLAALSLQHILQSARQPDAIQPDPSQPAAEAGPNHLWKKYQRGLLLTAGIFLLLLWFYFHLDYTTWSEGHFLKNTTDNDTKTQVQSFLQSLRDDRATLFLQSLIRSFLFIAAAAITAALYIKGKIKSWIMLAAIGILAFVDTIGIDLNYLNNSNYKTAAVAPAARMDLAGGSPIASPADSLILKDTGYYRVFDLRYGAGYTLSYGASTAWFHRSIGGYNAAKLSIYQDLIEHQLINYPHCRPVLNMLNTRYLIQPGSHSDTVVRNEEALGPVWLAKGITYAATAKQVMEELTSLNTKDTAILFQSDSGRTTYDPLTDPATCCLPEKDAADSIRILNQQESIQLVRNNNDEMVYQSLTTGKRFAVFSEIYYNRGWKAYIDGAETPIFRTNYTLRGVTIPPGRHTIRMVFHPKSFYIAQIVQQIAGILTLLLIISMNYIKVKELFKPKTA